MKSLGKQTVHVRTLQDGTLISATSGERTIYQKGNGTFWVNWIRGHRQVQRRADGTFEWEVHYRSIKTHTIGEVIADLKNKLKENA